MGRQHSKQLEEDVKIVEAWKNWAGRGTVSVGRTGSWDGKMGKDHLACSGVDK